MNTQDLGSPQTPAAGNGPVLLALSTFRRSQECVAAALDEAARAGALVVVCIADINLARYLIGEEAEIPPEFQQRCERDVLMEHERECHRAADDILKLASARGIEARKYVSIGRFALEVLPIAEKEKPSLILTTRSKRPAWVRKFFGSPVDYLAEHAPCPVRIV